MPIVLTDSMVYGTLDGFAHHVDETINEAQFADVRLMAELVADHFDRAETSPARGGDYGRGFRCTR